MQLDKTQWYYARDGRQHGPLTLTQMAEAARGGQLGASDLVWREGMVDWLPASAVREVSGLLSAPTAPAPQNANYPAAQGQSPYQQPYATAPTQGYAQPGAPQHIPYGVPVQGGYTPQGQSHNGMAVGAFVSSLCGLVVCGIGAIVGVILGYNARNGMRASGNYEGAGMATAAIVIGWIGIGWNLLLIVVYALILIAAAAGA